MQVYKSAGAVDRAKKFYDQYSQVPEQMLKVRELMKKKKRASSLALYSNIELKDAKPSSATAVPKNQLSLNNYEEDLLGLINSFQDRYPFNEELYHQVMSEWVAHKDDIRVKENEAQNK